MARRPGHPRIAHRLTTSSTTSRNARKLADLADKIKRWGIELGFQQVGIAGTDLREAESHLLRWLALGRHGEMHYMGRHGTRRSRPSELVPDTLTVISARMSYLPTNATPMAAALHDPLTALVSRYALGRDYHKVLRGRLRQLARRITQQCGDFGYRVFVDSAPVLEKALGEKAGIGWIGKHTNLVSVRDGSWFFLGELYTDLPLPADQPAKNHCGRCRACLEVCPTKAIVAPYELDARRCISYLTIELRGSVPEDLRPLIGNRVYGCDDCQLACPWNRFAQATPVLDFAPRHRLDASTLIELFGWSETQFLTRTEGSAIRRIGYPCWLRNLAIGLGNAPPCAAVQEALLRRRDDPSELVREHIRWAQRQQRRHPSQR